MTKVREFLKKINIDGESRFDESMAAHTSFKIGGNADAWVAPRTSDALAALICGASKAAIPFVVIGAGANVLVGDSGIRELVISTESLSGIEIEGCMIMAEAGLSVVSLAESALMSSLTGLEFAAGLPGSVGGAIFMNARCYEREFADILVSTDWLDTFGNIHTLSLDRNEWAYKSTPFMQGGSASGGIIICSRLTLSPGNRDAIKAAMDVNVLDRIAKGHFDHPCAGSIFKNDRSFGKPTGKILDELGFRGKRVGTAMVSEKHANIFVNPGGATATDMLALIRLAQKEARTHFGFELEPEVVFLGEFQQ